MYNIKHLVGKEKELKKYFKEHFASFFAEYSYESSRNNQIKKFNIEFHNDISSLRHGSGFYLILSDYMALENPCTLEIDGLKAIYRGHGVRVRKRVESHLFNSLYNENKDRTNYTVCMKLNDDNGINITQEPYASYQWAVVQHPMTDSSKTIREQAEQAFDEIYNMPIGSNA